MTKAFVTGTDKNQEWMSKWFILQHRKLHPEVKLVFACFGQLSDEVYNWVSNNVDVVLEYEKGAKCAWFLKPQALIDSPYDISCWMDLDCQLVRPMDDVFDHVTDHKLGVTIDAGRKGNWFATGLVVSKSNSPLLIQWRDACKVSNTRGDQEVLKQLLDQDSSLESSLVKLDVDYQWLRRQLEMRQDSETKRMVHWTGPAGKKHIRENIMTSSDFFKCHNTVTFNSYPTKWKYTDKVPCDKHFCEYVSSLKKERLNILHIGTGDHHLVGKSLTDHNVLGITASKGEYDNYIDMILEDSKLALSYKVLFGDMYTLHRAPFINNLDIVTCFHLCEYSKRFCKAYNISEFGQITDEQLIKCMFDMLHSKGKLLLFKGSNKGNIAHKMVSESKLFKKETEMKTLTIFAKR